MRKLSWISRVFAATAAIAATALIVGGSYYVGFVGEVQRGLNDPQSASHLAAEKMARVEQALGYQGFLRAYRTFRLTGDMTARQQMSQRAMEAARTLDSLRSVFAASPEAILALQDVNAIVEEFSRLSRSAPETANTALRGSASMEAIDAMPQVPQLEATYLTLRTGLERLRAHTRAFQMGSVAWALSWSQMLIVCALAALVCGLIAVASLLQIGITQPLKSLTQSLRAAGEGRLTLPIWGTDRADEIGDMARASEKLRKSLTETDALQELARKGQLNIRIEGQASALLERTISEVVANVQQATDALQRTASELQETQAAQRHALAAQASSVEDFGHATRQVVLATTSTLKDTTDRMMAIAETRDSQLSKVAGQFEETGRKVSETVDVMKARSASAIDNLTGSISAFSKAADSAQTIQGALFASCDRISSDAASTSRQIQSLAERLEHVIATVETPARAASQPASIEMAPAPTGDMDDVLRLFRDEQPGEPDDRATLRHSMVQQIVAALRETMTPDRDLLQQVEAMRGDIRELAMRMTEERILMTAEMPAHTLAAEAPMLASRPQRSLADVPADEIMERLRRLSDEMAAPRASNDDDQAPGLTGILQAFSQSVKPLGNPAMPVDELRDMAPELERHALTIEQSAREVGNAAALRTELEAITAELRTLATSIKDAPEAAAGDLRETALYLGARAETLFTYLNEREGLQPEPSQEVPVSTTLASAPHAEPVSRTTHDLSTLAHIISSLETRTAALSDEAVAANLSFQLDAAGAALGPATGFEIAGDTDEAIAVVYEAVERLNNIAAALARAADASKQRAAASA